MHITWLFWLTCNGKFTWRYAIIGSYSLEMINYSEFAHYTSVLNNILTCNWKLHFLPCLKNNRLNEPLFYYQINSFIYRDRWALHVIWCIKIGKAIYWSFLTNMRLNYRHLKCLLNIIQTVKAVYFDSVTKLRLNYRHLLISSVF